MTHSIPRSPLFVGACAAIALAMAHAGPTLLGVSAPQLVADLALLVTLAALACIFWAITETRSWISATALGLTFGLIYYGITCYWLGESVVADPSTYSLQALATEFGALLLLFPWWGAAAAMTRLSSRVLHCSPRSLPSALLVALWFSVADVLMSDLLYGIPLAPISRVLLDSSAQPLFAVGGIHGAAMALFLIAAVVMRVARHPRLPWWTTALTSSALAVPAVLLASLHEPTPITFTRSSESGSVYLAQTAPPLAFLDTAPDPLERTMQRLVEQIEAGSRSGADLIVLPENAVPVDLSTDRDARKRLANALSGSARGVLAGYTRIEMDQDYTPHLHNTAAVVSRNAALQDQYIKAHLVPFGEFVPNWLAALGLRPVVGPASGIEAGPSLQVTQRSSFPNFAILICYEGIASGAVSRETDGAEWLLNISSEGLFGRTLGSRLLLDYVRLRSAETGLPTLRAVSTGYTAIIDHRGAVVQYLAPGERSGLLTGIPNAAPTLFREIGYTPLYIIWAGLLTLAIASSTLPTLRTKGHRRSLPAATRETLL